MRILDRYLLREFLRAFFGILLVFAIMLLMKELLRELTDILVDDPPGYQVALYFLYTMPSELFFAIPTTVILAMMFSLGNLAKQKELLAMHASGLSYVRLARPLAICIGIVTLLVYLGNETLVPTSIGRARYIKNVVFEGKDQSVLTRNRNITTKGKDNRFYSMKNFDAGISRMDRPTITEHTEDGRTIRYRVDAASAQLVERNEDNLWVPVREPQKDRHYHWLFEDAAYFRFDEEGRLVGRRHHDYIAIPMEENLDRFLSTNRHISEMGLIELAERVSIERQRDKSEYYYRMRTNLHNRLAMPLATFLLGMLGYTFAVRSSIRSLVLEFGLALTSLVAYYALVTFWEKMGNMGLVHPMFGAWATNILFALVLVWQFRQLEAVPG